MSLVALPSPQPLLMGEGANHQEAATMQRLTRDHKIYFLDPDIPSCHLH